MRPTRHHDSQRGAVAIEFGLMLLFILMPLLAGAIDFGFLLHTQHVVTGAAREGVMLASRDGNAVAADVAGVVRDYIAANRVADILDPARAEVVLNRDNANVVVSVAVNYAITAYPLIQWQDILPGVDRVSAAAAARPR